MNEAYQYARKGTGIKRYALVQALETQPKNFEVKPQFDADEKKVETLVKTVEKDLNCEVTEAHVAESIRILTLCLFMRAALRESRSKPRS